MYPKYFLLTLVLLVQCQGSASRYTVNSQKDFEHILCNSSYFFASGSTIELLPGDYTVESINYNVVVRDVTNVTWIGSSSPTSHPTVSVNCDGKASFIFINSTNLHISGIKFIQCGLAIPEVIAHEAVTVQSHSFYRIPNGTSAALLFINVYSLLIERVNITESPGYGLLAINLLGNSQIVDSFFHLNGIQAQIQYSRSKFYKLRENCTKMMGSCKGGNALIVFQDTKALECSKNDTFSVNGSVFSSGVTTESLIECSNSHCIIPGSSGLGIISGQTSYTIRILIINDTFIGNHAYSGANMLIVVYNRVNYRMYIAKSNFSNAKLDWLVDEDNLSSLDNNGGVTYINTHKMPASFIPLCNKTNECESIYFFLKVQHCIFSNNTADKGAAFLLRLMYIDKIYITECVFRENKGQSVLHFEVDGYNVDSHFTKPGAIYLTDSIITDNNPSGYVNHAIDVVVGAVTIFLHVESHKILEVIKIRNTTFAENRGNGDATALNIFQSTQRIRKVIFFDSENITFTKNEENILTLHYTSQLTPSESQYFPASFPTIFNFVPIHFNQTRPIDPRSIGSIPVKTKRGNQEATAPNGIGKTTLTIGIKNSSFYHNVQTHVLLPKQSGTVFLYNIRRIIFAGCTCTNNQGSAIASVGSSIYFSGDTYFIANEGEYGGALALYYRSSYGNYFSAIPTQLFFYSHTHLYLVNNKATQRGGAIFVQDPPIEIFMEYNSYSRYSCFYQVVQWHNSQNFTDRDINIRLENNTALIAGNSLYGGLNKMCRFSGREAVFPVNEFHGSVNAFDSLFSIPMPWSPSELASNPHTLCTCHNKVLNTNLDCKGNPIQQSVYPGQTFKILAVVIGDPSNFYSDYSAVPAAIRVETVGTYKARLGVRQNTQQLGNNCGELTLSLSTSEPYVEVILSVELPVETKYLDLLTVHNALPIQTTLMSCPFGFQLNSDPKCDCNDQLQNLNCTCFIDDQTARCPVATWVGNYSNNVIVHNHCPFDFCNRKSVFIDLEQLDKQCTFNRSGMLCGGCKLHFSLALGTSQCIKCSNIFLLLLAPFILAGLLLVALIQICNFTVTTGTINGPIYFINIIRINHAIFFPSGESDVLSVLTAWLNLDLGIQTCFYDGMDMYGKTWLQFVFPLYVWILVGAIIKLSYHSTLMSKLVGSNAVPVLATLFLLSYAKLLRTVITVLSFTHLTNPDGSVSAVWLYDGNVPFLEGKHAVLFVMALIFTLSFILPYTLLLLFSPCLQAKSAHHGLHWVNKLKPFIDAYHGPYKDRFRNWTGIMLVVRAAQLIIFAFNVQGDPSVNLLVIVICTCLHLVFCWNLGTVYKNRLLNILDSYFLLLLGILAGASLYARTDDVVTNKQEAITKSVIGLAFAVFTLIVVVHILNLCKPYCGEILNWRNTRGNTEQIEQEIIIPHNNTNEHQCAPTISYFELREPLDLLENNS